MTDHLNSVRLVLDESGAVLDQIAYDAFGNIVAQLNPLLANPILFASREFDAETGLYYNRARYLDPTTGRWTTQDPLGFAAGDANLYRYVGNMATMATDPSGNIWYPGKYLYQMYSEYRRGQELDRQINQHRATQNLPPLPPPPHWTRVAVTEFGDGLRIGFQANVNAAATAGRSLFTLGFWAEPWEVWAVDDADRPFYEDGFLAARFGWELLPTAGIGKLTQVPGQMGRWGRYALYWDMGQNTVQVGRGGWDMSQNGLTWGNGLQVGGGLLGLGGNYTTWRRLPGIAPANPAHQVATNWRQHEQLVTQNLQNANPGRTIGTQVTLDVTNNATGQTVRIRIDNLVPQGTGASPTYQLVDAKFSGVMDLTTANLSNTVTPNQAQVYLWISSGQHVTVVPVGQNAINAGLTPGVGISVNPSVQIHVNGPNGIVVRTY